MYFRSSPLRINSTIPRTTSHGPGNKSLRVNLTVPSQPRRTTAATVQGSTSSAGGRHDLRDVF